MLMSIDELIQKAGNLPPLPQAAQKALELIRRQDASAYEIANVLSVDQVLASMMLRWANSAYYSLGTPVTTVQQAIVVLGQNTVQSLILTTSIASYLDRPLPGYGLDRGELWKHAIGVAAGARLLAQPFGRVMSEEAYHAGLLCDIGKLAFEILLRDMETNRPEWKGKSFDELEMDVFGIDHAALGAEMARRWKLPEGLVASIANHHEPEKAGKYIVLASSVHIADSIMMLMGIGLGKDGLQYELNAEAVKTLHVTDVRMVEIYEKVEGVIKDARSFIGMR